MVDMVTNVCVKFNYDWLCTDKASENFRKSHNNGKKKNVCSACGLFPGATNHFLGEEKDAFSSLCISHDLIKLGA